MAKEQHHRKEKKKPKTKVKVKGGYKNRQLTTDEEANTVESVFGGRNYSPSRKKKR